MIIIDQTYSPDIRGYLNLLFNPDNDSPPYVKLCYEIESKNYIGLFDYPSLTIYLAIPPIPPTGLFYITELTHYNNKILVYPTRYNFIASTLYHELTHSKRYSEEKWSSRQYGLIKRATEMEERMAEAAEYKFCIENRLALVVDSLKSTTVWVNINSYTMASAFEL